MLLLDKISKIYHGERGIIRAVQEASLHIQAGEFVAVRGPSGSGKTTLLLAAGGLLRPDEGTVRVNGAEPYALSPEARARFRAEHIGFVFQQFHLLPYLTVLENVLAAALPRPRSDAVDRARFLLEKVGLAARLDHLPAALSTGEKQRTALARALFHAPPLLLADEPTGNLDEANGQKVLEGLAEHARQGGAVLLVTHDPRAAAFAHRVLMMENGRLHPAV
ncbi:ABC transporter ATP-binding protein [Fontisphaera persica]|uniref:ABC transporter ATP-binding protein n=1 Tax=Fontisphaera persica TaxID=2974023 RepID=UPI0024BFD24D|nr:ABC transporter ATP-binding protein [Fontisphaera persica]WCJ59364.1 ABC transporter ATP-binding protein [Fontisphaera persica]